MKASLKVRRFHVKVMSDPKSPDTWRPCTVPIFDGDAEIGSYERTNAFFAAETFEPFELSGAWYALYTRDHACTRVMSLPDCRDIGGEEPHPQGFRPYGYFVPRYRTFETSVGDGKVIRSWSFESEPEKYETGDNIDPWGRPLRVGPWQSLDIGFVAGSIRDENTDLRLETFDLSRAHEGVIIRTARFGNRLQLGGRLDEAVHLQKNDLIPLRATIREQHVWDVATGRLVDPDDL